MHNSNATSHCVFLCVCIAGDDRYSTGAATTGSSDFRKRGPFLDSILDSFFWILGKRLYLIQKFSCTRRNTM